jgi:hypothetical protein
VNRLVPVTFCDFQRTRSGHIVSTSRNSPQRNFMNLTNPRLTRQMLEWIAQRPREYTEVMSAWKTTCPRLAIWEDACLEGFIDYERGTGKVILSEAGKAFLEASAALVPTEDHEAEARSSH